MTGPKRTAESNPRILRQPLRGEADLALDVERKLLRTHHFSLVSPELLRSVLSGATLLRMRAGEILLRQGSEDIDKMYILLDGEMEILVSERTVGLIAEPGESVGEMAIFTHQPRAANVRAKTNTELLELSARMIAGLRGEDPQRYVQLLELIARFLSAKVQRATQRLNQYQELLLNQEQLRSHSADLERLVQEKLLEVLLYAHVFRDSQDAILVAAPEGTVIYANQAAVALFDWKDRALGEISILDQFPELGAIREHLSDPAQARFKADWQVFGTVHGEIPMEATFSPVLREDRVVALALFLRDIRAFKILLESLEQSHAELAKHSRELEHKVAERTKELSRTNAELQQANVHLLRETREKDDALRKLGESQGYLLQSEKMIGLGHLAAGVAHEINNPIGYVSSNLGTMKKYADQLHALLTLYSQFDNAPATDPVSNAALQSRIRELKHDMDYTFVMGDVGQLISDAQEGVARVASIVRNLKEFTHDGQAQRQWVNLNENLDSTIQLIWNELKHKATVVREYEEIPAIECIPQQINQVFLNVLMNAAQAIEGTGSIKVRTAPDKDGIVISIQDDGCGIAPDNLPHVFEPFFTTRPIGKGMGLGLTSAYAIVRNHQGLIDVKSRVGAGTTVTIQLPVKQSGNSPAQAAS